MVVDSINMYSFLILFIDLRRFYFTPSDICLSISVSMSIKEKIEQIKNISLTITTKILSVIVYWIGVSLSFLLWKISTVFKKENKKSYWLESEEKEEDYKSQY